MCLYRAYFDPIYGDRFSGKVLETRNMSALQTRRILRNRGLCRQCGAIVESCHRQECVSCDCGAIAVDGGREYLRRTASNPANFMELSELEQRGRVSRARAVCLSCGSTAEAGGSDVGVCNCGGVAVCRSVDGALIVADAGVQAVDVSVYESDEIKLDALISGAPPEAPKPNSKARKAAATRKGRLP
jgi:hypothetical protein